MSERLDTRARRLVDLKDAMNTAEIAFESAKRAYKAEEKSFWLDLADEMGNVKKFASDLGEGYGTIEFQRRETITSRILDKEQAEAALAEEGLEHMLGPREIRKQPLNQEVRNRVRSGQGLPEGIDFHARRYIAVSRKD